VIEFQDFGGKGKTLHFAHANAYPIKTYSNFLNILSYDFQVIGMNQRPVWPNEDPENFINWNILADDLIEFLEQQNLTDVYALGHSMGGIATLMASIKRPDLFKKIILIDPVILPELYYPTIEQSNFEQLKKMNPLITIALNRRNKWSTIEEARTYFEGKTFYKKFNAEAKNDFLQHGLQKEDGGLRLSYPREWEARIYGTVTNPWNALREITTETMIIKAEFSDVIRSENDWKNIQDAAQNATCIEMKNVGHLIPQEKPKELVSKIKSFLQ